MRGKIGVSSYCPCDSDDVLAYTHANRSEKKEVTSSEALDHLMDKEWPDEKREAFVAALADHPELRGVHDLRTRTSGMHDFVQFHATVDPRMTIAEAHRVMDELEARIEAEFPGVEVLIHPDPEGLVDEEGAAAEELLPAEAQGAPL